MKEPDDVADVSNVNQMATSDPWFVILHWACIPDWVKFILTLQSVFLVIMHLLLVESLLSGQSKGKAVTKTEIARFVLVVELFDLFMETIELVVVKKFRGNLALQAVEICLCKLCINALQVKKGVTVLALNYLSA